MSRDLTPYRLDGPLCVSFSGGRTSGYMLRHMLDAGLPDESFVLFANTGKERLETLNFIHEVETRWSVCVRWVEWRDGATPAERWVEVDYETASRAGEPFEALIEKKRYLPNPVTRFCTQNLKVEVIKQFMRAQGHREWTTAIGIRYDEPRRWRVEGVHPRAPHEERVLPLRHAGVTEADVMAFWSAHDFDLRLEQWEGNCDLCFLKGAAKRRRIMQDRPDLADWWIEQEDKLQTSSGSGARFRGDQPSYRELRKVELSQLRLFQDDDMLPCTCTD